MAQLRIHGLLALGAALLLGVPAGAAASSSFHECQKPVRTGVEVSRLHAVSAKVACPVALELFAWENATASHARALYGCSRPKPEAPGYPFLRLHRFRGWRISLRGSEKEFTLARGQSSFAVGGTDFPLNCT